MATVHLFCGKMAAGKSTLAARLAVELDGVLLVEDDLLSGLFPGEVVDVASYAERARRIALALRPALVALARAERPLLLDFPANTRGQRARLLGLVRDAGADPVLHWLDCADELCLTRLAHRGGGGAARRPSDTREMFEAMTAYFEAPAETEGVRVIVHEAR